MRKDHHHKSATVYDILQDISAFTREPIDKSHWIEKIRINELDTNRKEQCFCKSNHRIRESTGKTATGYNNHRMRQSVVWIIVKTDFEANSSGIKSAKHD